MKLKGRGILSLCLLLFGGLAVYDYYRSRSEDAAQIQEARLMLLNYEQVERLEIHRQEDHLSLQRSSDGWKLEYPLQEAADSAAVEQYIKDIYPERILETAAEGPEIQWAKYGLEPAFATVTMTDTQGAKNSFHISAKKNFEGNIFARRNDENRVLVLNPSWESRGQKAVIDFRDRRVYRHKIASVDELTVRNDHGSFTLQRVDGRWKVRGYGLELDQNKVRELLTVLADAKADQIEDVSKASTQFQPLFQLEAKAENRKWSAKVYLNLKGDKKIYALTADPNFWMRLESGTLDEFIKKDLKSLEVKSEEPAKDLAKEAAQAAQAANATDSEKQPAEKDEAP